MMIGIQWSMSPKVASFLQVFLLTSVMGLAAEKPPTLDPTYGMPSPFPVIGKIPSAEWIWADKTTDHQVVFFRREIDLDAAPKSAGLYITADDSFRLFVNGREIDHSENNWRIVHHLDVAQHLHAGKNVLAVRVENIRDGAGLVARLELPDDKFIATDAQWKIFSHTNPPADWTALNFNDSTWTAPKLIAQIDGEPWKSAGGLQGWPGYVSNNHPYLAHLALRPIKAEALSGKEAIQGLETLIGEGAVHLQVDPASSPSSPPVVLLDFGKEIAGCIQIEGTDGGIVDVSTGESREECLASPKDPWRGSGLLMLQEGKSSSSPYSGFRYAKLSFTGKSPLTLTNVSLDHKYYPVEYKGSFSCSDPLLTRIWYTGAYTTHLCMQEDIWDGPKRDRSRWIGDLQVSGEVINNVFADTFLMERTMSRLRNDAQGRRAATDLPTQHVNQIPGYSCAWICSLADFYRHSGDDDYLRRQHDLLVSMLEYQRADLDERGVFANKQKGWNFTDWSNVGNANGCTHLFLVLAVREAAFLLKSMGDTANAAKYAAWSDQLAEAGRHYFADPVTHTYSDKRQENAMAIYSGVATPQQAAAIYDSILQPDNKAWDNPATPYYNNFVLFAMSETGHNTDALKIIRRYWGGMLDEGATTFWEAYDPKWQKDDFHHHLEADGKTGYFVSLCHGWSTGPTNWLTERLLGIRPTSGGFKTAEIAPDLGDLTWAEGDVPTPHGKIHVRVEKADSGLVLHLTLPPGTDATVSLPGHSIVLDGKPVPSTQRDDRAHLHLAKAGEYLLTSGR